jgi:4-alpha-glucanotransferase
MALKDANYGRPWQEWEEPLRRREEKAMEKARVKYARDLRFWEGVQYLFFHQWEGLKRYANDRGIRFIGDLPIYVSADSADVWARPEQFQLDGELRPVEVAGVPPDGFTADGQLWGNPLFERAELGPSHLQLGCHGERRLCLVDRTHPPPEGLL